MDKASFLSLFIDTTGTSPCVALYDSITDQTEIKTADQENQRASETIVPLIDSIIPNGDYTTLTHVVTISGPGSFTGARVGVAAANAILMSTQAIPITLTAFQAHALSHLKQQETGLIFSAESNSWQIVDSDAKAITPPTPVNDDTLVGEIIKAGKKNLIFLGQLSKHTRWTHEALVEALSAYNVTVYPPPLAQGLEVKKLIQILAKRTTFHNAPKPFYIKDPDIKPQGNKALPRA